MTDPPHSLLLSLRCTSAHSQTAEWALPDELGRYRLFQGLHRCVLVSYRIHVCPLVSFQQVWAVVCETHTRKSRALGIKREIGSSSHRSPVGCADSPAKPMSDLAKPTPLSAYWKCSY